MKQPISRAIFLAMMVMGASLAIAVPPESGNKNTAGKPVSGNHSELEKLSSLSDLVDYLFGKTVPGSPNRCGAGSEPHTCVIDPTCTPFPECTNDPKTDPD